MELIPDPNRALASDAARTRTLLFRAYRAARGHKTPIKAIFTTQAGVGPGMKVDMGVQSFPAILLDVKK